MWCRVQLLSSLLFLGLHFSLQGLFVDGTTTEEFEIPYRCPEAMFYCKYDGKCYSYEYLCRTADTSTAQFTTVLYDISTDPPEQLTTVLPTDEGNTEAPDENQVTDNGGETTPQDVKSVDMVTKSDMTSQPADQITDDTTIYGTTQLDESKFTEVSTLTFTIESTSIRETVETTPSLEDPKVIKTTKDLPSSTDQTTISGSDVMITTEGSIDQVSSESPEIITSDQSTSSTSIVSASSSNDTAVSVSTQTASSQTSSTPITTSIPSSSTSDNEDVLVQTSVKTTPAPSNSVILVFKGHLANPYHFNATLLMDLATMFNETIPMANPFVLNLHRFGPKNSTITTEVSAVQSYINTNMETYSRVVPSTEILAVLSKNTTADWKIADVEFVCGYPSKDKPCATLPLPYKPTVVTSGGLFEDNKDLFIAIFVLASLFLLILILGLIYLRCRQKRCSSYETNNVKLEKAKLTSATEVNPEINSPLSDKEILKGEMETSLSQNGAPPLDKDAGWIIPLDQILDNRKNSSSTDTKL